MNTSSTSAATSAQGIPPSLNCSLNTSNANSMAGEDIRLPTFNGNGVEDPDQHWFFSEVVWTVHKFKNEDISKS